MSEQDSPDHGTRIALLEQAQRDTKDYFEKAHRESKDQLRKMADDMAKIAHAVAQQAEDRSALGRAFSQLEIQSKQIVEINVRMNKHDQDALQRVIDAQAKEIADAHQKRREFWGIMLSTGLMAIGTVFAGLTLYHFGVKP